MKTRTLLATLAPVFLVSVALTQTWEAPYDRALGAARAGNWSEAREFFKQAISFRADDQAKATNLPGPISEPRVWRRGSPYSPNFGAAYAAYRQAVGSSDQAESNRLMVLAGQEFEALIAKGQVSEETVFFLRKIYTTLQNTEGKAALSTVMQSGANWKVDNSFVTAEDLAAISPTSGTQGTSRGSNEPRQSGQPNQPRGSQQAQPGQIVKVRAGEEDRFRAGATTQAGPVATRDDKFALVIGNSETKIEELKVEFAASDAEAVKKSLTEHAGYREDQVTLVTNGTSAQILEAAKALAERVPDGGVVTIYFSGVAVNLDGKDYYAGVEAEFATNTQAMIAKSDLFRLFMVKGARIFVFNQTHRPMTEGNYFGKEVGIVGAIAQVHATMAGQRVFGVFRSGNQIGLFTQAMTSVLSEFRSNSIPISEFTWELFYTIRRGSTGGVGGGSIQTPTLPIRTNIAEDARF